MRSRKERKLYKQQKYVLKQSYAELNYKYGIYVLNFISGDYTYTLSNTSLQKILERYYEVKSRQK